MPGGIQLLAQRSDAALFEEGRREAGRALGQDEGHEPLASASHPAASGKVLSMSIES